MPEEEYQPRPPPSPSETKMTHDDHHKHHHRRRVLCACIVILLLLAAGITALTLWLVYRPRKPQFTVVGVTVLNLNTTSSPPPLVSAAIQFGIITRNPNRRVSIIYDRLSAFVSYRNQMITQPVTLPPLFHEKQSTVQMAPVLGGGGCCGGGGGGGDGGGCCGGVPVSPEVWNGLEMDESNGVVGLRLVVLGRMRWKLAGFITTGHYGIYVKCDVVVRMSEGYVGQVPFAAPPVCNVDV